MCASVFPVSWHNSSIAYYQKGACWTGIERVCTPTASVVHSTRAVIEESSAYVEWPKGPSISFMRQLILKIMC